MLLSGAGSGFVAVSAISGGLSIGFDFQREISYLCFIVTIAALLNAPCSRQGRGGIIVALQLTHKHVLTLSVPTA